MNFNKFLKEKGKYVLVVLFFLALAFAFCYPVLEGKVINSQDIITAKGQQGEINEYLKKEGRTILWTNSMFSGMPTYLLTTGTNSKVNIFHRLSKYVRFGLPRYSVDIIFLYLIGFFILGLAFGANIWISLIGSFAFALSSYNIIYIEAGHVNKTLAMSMMAPILAGIVYAHKGKLLVGSLLFCCSLGIQLAYNHLQITYYTMLIVICWGAYNLIYSIQSKELKKYTIFLTTLIIAVFLSIVPNLVHIFPTYEYLGESSRGGSELSINESGEKSKGLDKSYAFAWSYSPSETFTLLIPNFKGGATIGSLDEKSHLYKALRENNASKAQARQYISQVYTYWGVKSSTAGPFYYGAIIVFLFVFGMFILPGKQKWWIFTISLLSILWSWGENFYGFSSFSFDYIPLFNKFRVPENFLVIPSLTFPLVAILVIQKIVNNDYKKNILLKHLKYSIFITTGLLLFVLLFANGLFSFDSQLDAAYGRMPDWFLDAIHKDRGRLLKIDAFRSIVYIVLGVGVIWFYINKKLKIQYFYAGLAILVLFDLWGVDKRYLNSEDFERPKKAREITPTQADLQILQDKDPNFRVFNVYDPFRESRTSYFHKSLGGYHAAKIARYDDIIQYHLSKNNRNVINMLNTKYFIIPNKEGQDVAQRNPDALGNAWFVKDLKWVGGAKEESEALNSFDPSSTAIVDKKYEDYFKGKSLAEDIEGKIELTSYHPEKLEYKIQTSSGGFAVFSEIYYNNNKGWNAYLDGEKVPHLRVDYILRGMYIPRGEHNVVFKFEPPIVQKAKLISSVGSIVVIALILMSIALSFIKNKHSKSSVSEKEKKELD